MRVLVAESYKTLSKLKPSEAKQITWDRVGTFETSKLKEIFKQFKRDRIEAIDIHLEGETVVLSYPRGEIRLYSQHVRGNVHGWKPWFDLGGTPECNETETEDRHTPEYRRKSFRLIFGGAA